MRKFISIVFMFVLILTHQAVAQQWWNVGSAGFSDAAVSDISIAIDGNGTLYAAYPDCSGGWEVCTFKMIVKKYNGSSWVDVGSPGFSPEANGISLAIDGSGTPYVAYGGVSGSEPIYKANVMKYSEGNWANVGSADFSAGETYYISLAIDGSGTPYVAYKDIANANKATVMRYSGGNWANVGLAGFSAGEVYYTSLEISPNGTPIVGYMDSGNSEKATVMKYSVNQADPLPVELSSFIASTAGSSIVLNWQTATEVNNYGFEVERTAPLNLPQGETSGLRDWEKIGFVQGNGNSNSPKEYSFTDENPPAGNLQYRLKQIDTDGQFEYYGTIAEINLSPTGVNEEELPKEFALMQNYPNPFNPVTRIEYRVVSNEKVTLKVYDVLGNEVATLVNENKEPGEYKIEFDGINMSSGIYYYQLRCGSLPDGKAGFVDTKKFMLMK